MVVVVSQILVLLPERLEWRFECEDKTGKGRARAELVNHKFML